LQVTKLCNAYKLKIDHSSSHPMTMLSIYALAWPKYVSWQKVWSEFSFSETPLWWYYWFSRTIKQIKFKVLARHVYLFFLLITYIWNTNYSKNQPYYIEWWAHTKSESINSTSLNILYVPIMYNILYILTALYWFRYRYPVL